MSASTYSRRTSWSARLLIGLALILAGAAAATWALARYQPAARFLGIVPAAQPVRPVVLTPPPSAAPENTLGGAPDTARVAELETRVSRVENATEREAKPGAGPLRGRAGGEKQGRGLSFLSRR